MVLLSQCPTKSAANRQHLDRDKGRNRDKSVMVFIHQNIWLACPLHSLACHLLHRPGRSDDAYLFPDVNGKESRCVNELLNQVFKWWNDDTSRTGENSMRRGFSSGMTSHSMRKSPANQASTHPDISIEHLHDRGGVETEKGIITVFRYLVSNRAIDMRVGRVVSEWQHTTQGGYAPNPFWITGADVEPFKLYAADLIGHLTDQQLKFTLVMVLLMYYEDVKSEYPRCTVIRKMEGKEVSC